MKAAAVLCLVAAAWAAPQGGYNYQNPVPQEPEYPSAPAQYNFQWDVDDQYSGNFYGQQEQRDGDNTQGSYYVRLPDTRLMRVAYYVDAYGFHPTVTYEGEAQYPSAPAQVYSQPAPAPTQLYNQPALVTTSAPVPVLPQVYSQPAPQPAPTQQYSQPAPALAPTQVYSQPAPAPTQQYAQPDLTPALFYSQPGK